jgi:hypothetical protein
MTWDDDKVSALYYDAVTNVDPSAATIVMDIYGTVYPMDWDGAATSETRWDSTRRESVTTWRRTAHTVTALAGVSVTPGAGKTVLTSGTHVCEPRITIGGTVIPAAQFVIEAKAAATP